jgi:lysophospholipase L1-like esterase
MRFKSGMLPVHFFRGAAIAALIAGFVCAPGPARAQAICPATSPVTFNLPHLRSALNSGMEGIVVALGSSSTLGVAASDAAHSYPAILQFVLNGLLPHGHIAVLNRGIGGQDAPEELARLDTDVVAIRPHLVVWQIGANGALRGEDPAEFRRLVIEGVHRLHRAGIDVVLMDSQRSPKVEAAKSHGMLDAVLADVAKETGAGLFSRAALMDEWAKAGSPLSDFVASDRLHHNDRGYTCVARALAASIATSVRRHEPLSASR